MQQKPSEQVSLDGIKERIKHLMSTAAQGLTDLTNAITALGADMSAGFTSVLAEITALQGQSTGVSNAQLEALASTVTGLKNNVDTFVAAATAPAPTTPAPATGSTTPAPATGDTAPASS